MTEWLCAVFLVVGATFMLISAIGVARMPDLLTRVHASTKAGTMGLGLIFISVAVFFHHVDTTARALSTVLFVFMTAPVAAHLIGRGGLLRGIRLWKGSLIDEMRTRPDKD